MKRFTLVVVGLLLALPLRAEPPTGPAPKLAVAIVDKSGSILIEDAVLEFVTVQETRTVTENGIARQETVNKTVPRQKTIQRSHDGKKVAAYDMDGRQITPGRLASILHERKAVAIAQTGGKLPAAYRAALRDDVVVLVLPSEPEVLP